MPAPSIVLKLLELALQLTLGALEDPQQGGKLSSSDRLRVVGIAGHAGLLIIAHGY